LTFLINSSKIYAYSATVGNNTPIDRMSSINIPITAPVSPIPTPTLMDDASSNLASPADQVVQVQAGNIAPFGGILFAGEKANSLRLKVLELDKYKKLSDSYSMSLSALSSNYESLDRKTRMLEKQNIKLADAVEDASSMSVWKKIGYFALGIGVTVLGGLAVKNAGK